MSKPQIEFTPTSCSKTSTPSPFKQETTPDLTTQPLSHDPTTGDSTLLLTHHPGSEWGDPICIHPYHEEVLILSGRLYDKSLGKWFGPGSYCCRPPGMEHGPYAADEKEGCTEICWLRYPRLDEKVAKAVK